MFKPIEALDAVDALARWPRQRRGSIICDAESTGNGAREWDSCRPSPPQHSRAAFSLSLSAVNANEETEENPRTVGFTAASTDNSNLFGSITVGARLI
jgi:hypothetical protein